ncbi:MAG TPA: leucyl aminopeptidase family protein [Steroidobacteraceae bacterium]|nr:leucyl aminopeptidase family protein [Steroidobacteraceae bacterium]
MSHATLLTTDPGESLPLWLLTEAQLPGWLGEQGGCVADWVRSHGFQAERYRALAYPGRNGALAGAVLGLGALKSTDDLRLWHAAGLTDRLPPQTYHVANKLAPEAATHFVLGWLVGAYRLGRYRAHSPPAPRSTLVAPAGADLDYARAAARACELSRDLINTPANDMGPAELAEAAVSLGTRCGASTRVIVGDALQREGFPLIHAVGAGSSRAPRLIDLRWGDAAAPRVTLVGKGVCFDTGGLDLKPSAAMLLMKKDMGGGACALGLAQLLMQLSAPVNLRVLVPAVENSVDGNAYRPGDVLRSRKGLTVEIGNTDAEGRLVLADALAEADSEQPDLLVDLATLTGAARVALGPELPAAFSPDARLLEALQHKGDEEADPVWPLPLWTAYEEELASKVADLGNVAAAPFAGSIIGALFLKRFVTATPAWMHLDLYAWNPKERPGRPVGAEAQCIRALYRLIRERCSAGR